MVQRNFRLIQEECGLPSEAPNPTATITNYQSKQHNNPYNYNLQQNYKFITHCIYTNGSHTSYFIYIGAMEGGLMYQQPPPYRSLKLLTLPPSAPYYICLLFCQHTHRYGYPLVANALGWFSRPAGLKGTQKQYAGSNVTDGTTSHSLILPSSSLYNFIHHVPTHVI
jgi:hypothetical protein